MAIKKENQRITVTLDPERLKALQEIKKTFKCKNNAIAIKWLIDIYLIIKNIL